MGYYGGGWPAYVSVGERVKQAEKRAAKLRKAGAKLTPVTVTGSKIATTFWGRAWCSNLESYRDYANRLERGRSYVRNGLVVDLQIAAGRITGLVSGSDMYTVTISITEAEKPHWKAICADCAGGIDSLVELLAGRFSQPVMARLCQQTTGLFPRPAEIKFNCSCPDWADMCKHVAAVCYGVGARLDERPELLFRLRGVDEADLIAHIDTATPLSKNAPGAGRVLELDDVSALFGLEMDAGAAPAIDVAVAAPVRGSKRKIVAVKPPVVKPPVVKPPVVKPPVVKPSLPANGMAKKVVPEAPRKKVARTPAIVAAAPDKQVKSPAGARTLKKDVKVKPGARRAAALARGAQAKTAK